MVLEKKIIENVSARYRYFQHNNAYFKKTMAKKFAFLNDVPDCRA